MGAYLGGRLIGQFFATQEKDKWNEMNENTELYMEKSFLKNVSKCTTLMFKYQNLRVKRCTNLISRSVRVAVFRA